MGDPTRFRIFKAFDDPALSWAARSTFRLDRKSAPHFRGDPLVERVVAALAERRAISIKEVLESFEVFARTRKRLRQPVMADLCCGHGLTGLLFAAFERSVEKVVLLDREEPKNAHLVYEAVCEAAPWTAGKVRRVKDDIERAADHLDDGAAIIAVHACGVRTDRAIDAALTVGGPVAVVPCCYAQTGKSAPRALRDALGVQLATDVERTYRLEARGFEVAWSAIPEAITPMNRILIGLAPS